MMLLKSLNIKLKSKNMEHKIPHVTNSATKATLNVKINEGKGKTTSISNLATTTTTFLTTVGNKIPNVSNLIKNK